MKTLKTILVACSLMITASAQESEPPREWVDADTGHRVVRLSNEPGTASLYFHQHPYTPDGKKLLVTVPNGLAVIDLKTKAIDKIVDGRVNVVMTGMKTGNIYYIKSGAVYTVNPNTREVREIGKLPTPANGGSVGVATVNADETPPTRAFAMRAAGDGTTAPSPGSVRSDEGLKASSVAGLAVAAIVRYLLR